MGLSDVICSDEHGLNGMLFAHIEASLGGVSK